MSNSDLVAQFLNSPDAFEHISELRQKLQREKNVIDSQLQAGVVAQVKQLTAGMATLGQARERIDAVQTGMRQLYSQHTDSVRSVRDFSKIQQLSTVAANFDLAQKFVDNFQTLKRDIDYIKSLMDADGEFDIESRMPNLLPAHYALSQLRQVQEQALKYAEHSSMDVRQTIRRHFAPLDQLVERFDNVVFDIASCLLEILATGDRSLVVRVAKIIDYEERQDLLFDVAQQMKTPKRMAGLRSSASLKLKPGQLVLNHKPRHYTERFFRAIEASVKEIFTNCMTQFSPETQPEELLENLDWIYSDLLKAKTLLVQCVPERWAILDKFVEFYHQGTHRLLDSIMRFEPAAQTLLLLLQFSKEHYKRMETLLGIPKKQLTPPLLDGREKDLYDDYLKLLVSKLDEWYSTISVTEKRPFVTRSVPPEKHSDNTLGLDGHTTMFKLVSQQLEVAADSGQGRIVAGCVDACCEVLKKRENEWIQTVQSEVQREISVTDPDSEEVPRGLYEYIIALANDQSRAHDDLEELSNKWSAPLSRKYAGAVRAKFAEAQAGYFEVTKACIKGMLRIIFNDTKPAFEKLFRSSKWYKGVIIGQIVATLGEFMDDAQELMIPELFDIFTLQLCREVTLEYLRAMIPAQGEVKSNGYERVIEDIAALYELFSSERYEMDTEEIQQVFKVLECLCDTLQTDLPNMSDRFLQLREYFWDAPLDLFELMMGLSKAHGKKQLRETIAKVRLVAVQTQVDTKGSDDEPRQPTFLQNFRKV